MKFKQFFKKWKIIDSSKYYIFSKEEYKRVFTLSETEYNLSKNFIPPIEYVFTPTSIGYDVKIREIKSNKTYDITDYNRW